MHYWKILSSRSWDETLAVMGGATFCAFMVAVAVFIITILLIRWWRGHETMKDFVVETICGVLAVLVVGVVVFLVHFFYMTPARIYAEDHLVKIAITKPKPLPDKNNLPIDPPPAMDQNAASEIKQKKTSESPQFETNSFGLETESDEVEKFLQKKLEESQNAESNRLKRIKSSWENGREYFAKALEYLHSELVKIAVKKNDSIEKTSNYFQSIPESVDAQFGGFSVADIKLQKDTNWNFNVSFTGLIDADRMMVISCAGSHLNIRINGDGKNFQVGLYAHDGSGGNISIDEGGYSIDEFRTKASLLIATLVKANRDYISRNHKQ